MKELKGYTVYQVPVDEIYFDDEFNCRVDVSLPSVRTLADDIKATELREPIIIQPAADVAGIPAGFKWRIVCGHRRFVAVTRLLGWEHIPARVVDGLNAQEAWRLNLKENLERKQLNVVEEAIAISKRYGPETTIKQIMEDLGVYERWVLYRKWLLKVPADLQKGFASGRLPLYLVERIHNLPTFAEMRVVVDKFEANKLKPVDKKKASKPLAQSNKRRRTRKEISELVAMLGSYDLDDTGTRLGITLLGWADGTVSDYYVRQHLKDHVRAVRGEL